MKTYDLEYTNDGMFTRFIPNTPQGESAWRHMHDHLGHVPVILNIVAPQVIKQLRDAGYTVRKAKPEPMGMTDSQLLAELMS